MKKIPAVTMDKCTPQLLVLAHALRWRIMACLMKRKRVQSMAVATAVKTTPIMASRHLNTLRRAGLVIFEQEGQHRFYSIPPHFRKRLPTGEEVLDLGCCSFSFVRKDKAVAAKARRGNGKQS